MYSEIALRRTTSRQSFPASAAVAAASSASSGDGIIEGAASQTQTVTSLVPFVRLPRRVKRRELVTDKKSLSNRLLM